MIKKFFNIILIIGILGAVFFYRESIKKIWLQYANYYFPCKTPITYSIGIFDTRFNISKKDFLKAVSDAEHVWEDPINKNLFAYDPNGTLNHCALKRTDSEVSS